MKTTTKALLVFVLLLSSLQGYSQKHIEIFEASKTKDFKEIKKEVEKYYETRDKGPGTGYKPAMRWLHHHSTRLSPDGKIINVAQKELEEANLYKQKRAAMRIVQGPTANWTSRGPLSHTKLNHGYSDGIGRVNCIAVDPSNPNIIYAGTPAGGLWRSTTGGNSWAPLTDSYSATLGISGIVIDPNSSSSNRTIYILTGDGDAATTYSVGVLKSTNNGTTWNSTGLAWPALQFVRGYKLMMHPANSNILFAMTILGIYKTTDAGATWQLKTSSETFVDMEFKPGDPNTVYSSTNLGQIFRSTNNGETWTTITSGLPADQARVALAVSPANPNYVYIHYGDGPGIYRSTDAGLTYSKQSDINVSNGQGWYDLSMAVSPTNAEEVHIGGIDCWKSMDGGSNWIATSHWVRGNPGDYTHADIHVLEFFGSSLYCGSDGGVFKSSNNAEDWSNLSTGLSITEFYRIATDPFDATRVLGGAQDNGSNILQNNILSQWYGGDGMECIVDYNNPNIIYGCYQNGGLIKSMDNGQTMNFVGVPGGMASWVMPYVMDPVNSNILYAGKNTVWKTMNGGSGWTDISPGIFPNGYIRNLAVAPSNGNFIYVSSEPSSVKKTTNGGASWTDVSLVPEGGDFSLTYLAVHPTNPDIVYATLGHFGAGNKVYRTTSGGSTWVNISGSLPNVPANCIVYEKGSNNGIYVGTDIGVFYRNDNMTDWIPFSTGLPFTKVMELEIHYGSRKLVAGTYGRGIWETDLYSTNQNATVYITAVGSPKEGDTKGIFTITGKNITGNTTVAYTIGGSATSADYTPTPALSGSVSLTVAQPSVTIQINVVDDTQLEGSETLSLTLNSNAAYTIGSGTAQLVIRDNETSCTAPSIVFTSTGPVVDYVIEEAWSTAPSSPISKVVVGTMPSDYQGSWRALYDNTNLYLLIEGNDNLRYTDSQTSWWEDDAVEIFIDGDNSKLSSYDHINDFQLAFRVFDGGVKVGGNSVNRTDGISHVFNMNTTGGYYLEISIPWTTIGVTPFNGKPLGFDIGIDDDDNGGSRDAQVTAFATNSSGYQNPSVFGTVNLTVCGGGAPVITSALTASGATGVAFNYSITASNAPTSFNATPLPAGLSINTATGVISGTPTAAGTTNVSISATNASGTDTKTLVITIGNKPVITSALTKTGTVGAAFSYSITASNSPTSYNASPLPAGLSVNTSTGVISGTPTATGTTNVSISAMNGFGIDTKTLVVTISGTQAPVITSSLTATATTGTSFSYTIVATNSPTSYNATNLPSGLSVNTSTGVISGTPTVPGVKSVSISATNSAGTDTKTLTLTVNDPSGVITCQRAPGSITVNGSLSEAGWNITRPVTKNTVGTPNNTVTFGVLWDNTNLYIGAKVLDGNLYSESANMWEDDAIELYIDANYNKLTSYDGRDNQIIKCYNKSTVFTKLGIAGLQHAWAAVTGGYSIEIAIPWGELGITAPVSGTNLGFDIGYDDDDNGGNREGQAVWNGTADNYFNTSAFGRLTLNSATAPATAKLADIYEPSEVLLIPSPVTKGNLKVIDPEMEGEVLVQIRNSQGVMMYLGKSTADNSEINITISDLTPGVYILQLQSAKKSVNEKLVVE